MFYENIYHKYLSIYPSKYLIFIAYSSNIYNKYVKNQSRHRTAIVY